MTPAAPAAARPGGRGIVVSAHPEATEAGREVLAAGGNAVDAAVAAAWALCVCEPSGSGLGGQTVALLRRRGVTTVIDGHSYAPARVSRQTVTRAEQRLGYKATTVPTTPATLAYVHGRYGALPAARVLSPAIALAERGYETSRLQHLQLRWCGPKLDATLSGRRFLRHGRPYEPGETFRQPELAACLLRLSACGVEDFYRGEIARAVDRDMRRHGGLLRLSDLEAVREPAEREPIAGRYRDWLVQTMPPPGGGPQLLHALSALEEHEPDGWREHPEDWYLAIGGAVRSAFERRESEHRRASENREMPPAVLHGVSSERSGETTHLCTADADGNVVSLTQSIQSLFGAKVASDDFGFLYNNYLTTCPRRRHAHRLSGGCAARSNAAPTLVTPFHGTSVRALGAAGSRRIISSLVGVVSGVLDLDLSLSAALARARIHPRLRGKVWLERPAAAEDLVARLTERFGPVQIRGTHSYAMGAVQALELSDESELLACADPRRDGTAARC